MQTNYFFDCNCSVGKRSRPAPGTFSHPQDLKNRMQRYGIEKALVYHSMAREYDPETGNRMILAEIRDDPTLLPVWVTMHHHTGECLVPGTLVDRLVQHKIRAVRMFPAQADQNFSIAEWNCGELLGALADAGVVLLIGMNQLTWDELNQLCGNHPKLKVIFTDLNYRIDRNIYALLDRHPALHLESGGYKVHNGIEEICGRFGAQRLVFGSGMPMYSGASAVSMIRYARISEREKSLIAFGNLSALLARTP